MGYSDKRIERKFAALALFHKILDNEWYKPFIDGQPNIYKIEEVLTLEFYRGNVSFTQSEFNEAISLVKLLLTEENENGNPK